MAHMAFFSHLIVRKADGMHRESVRRYIQVDVGVRNEITKKVCRNCVHTGTIRLKRTCYRRYPRTNMLGSNLFDRCFQTLYLHSSPVACFPYLQYGEHCGIATYQRTTVHNSEIHHFTALNNRNEVQIPPPPQTLNSDTLPSAHDTSPQTPIRQAGPQKVKWHTSPSNVMGHFPSCAPVHIPLRLRAT